MQHHVINPLTVLNILFEQIFGKISQILHKKIYTASYLNLLQLLAKDAFFLESKRGKLQVIVKGKFLSTMISSIYKYSTLFSCIQQLYNLQLNYYQSQVILQYICQLIMKIKIHTYIAFLFILTLSFGRVPELSLNNFDGSFYFVQVYQDNCSNCQGQQKQLEDASKLLMGIAKIGKINLKSIPAMKGQKLPKNPTYFFVKGSIQDFSEYKQKISRISISKFILSQLEKVVKSRDSKLFGGKKGGSESSSGKTGSKKSGSSANAQKDGSGVTILSDNNFQQTVLKNDDAWFVEFYSPSCGHCHALQPEWDKLPAKIGKRVRIAKIDATVNRNMAQKFQIKGFPTLLFFGVDDKSTPVPYSSERTAQAMISWLQTQNIAEQKLEFMRLTKQSYNKQCNRNIVCLIFILDKKSQLKDLDFVEEVMQENKGKPLRFFYSDRLMKFEQALMIQDRSTPKLVSIWDSLNSYKMFNANMNKNQLTQYIAKIMERKSWIKFGEKIPEALFGGEKPTASEL